MRHLYFVFMAIVFSTIGLNAQTTLGPGDLGITGFNSDNPDEVALVALTDLAPTTEIRITDNGWKADNTFRPGEGFMVIQLNQEVACGTTLLLTASDIQNISTLVSVGSVSGTSIALAADGDQILVYQGDNASPAFITAINFQNAEWQSDATTSNESALPFGLTEGTNAFALAEIDNSAYNCNTTSGTASEILAAIYTQAAWAGDNTNRVTLSDCGFSVTGCGGGGGGGEGCGTLFFSEYIEGGGVNKCLEIYNPTGAEVDLAAGGYAIKLYSNGSTSATTFNLSGTLAAGDVFVFCDDGATADFLAVADQLTTASLWNGDDAIELVNSSGTLDIIGSIGNDPGSRWESANGNDTENQTLVRNSNIYQGITINPNLPGITGFPTLETEWTEFGQDYVADLGTHTFAGCPAPAVCSIDNIFMEIISGCDDNGTININDDYATAKVVVTITDAPATGDLVLTGDVLGNPSIPVGSIMGNMAQFVVQIPADGGAVSVSAYFSDEPSCALLNSNAATAPEACSSVPDCTYPFFSEYIEGSGNNKCLEIYNPTASDISLDDYHIEIYFNGSTSAGNTINFAEGAVLPAGGTYVVCSPAADDAFLDLADEATGGTSWFNGDDAVALVAEAIEAEEVIIDVIGQIGFDPGTQWTGPGISTLNRTIRRMPWIQAGDNNGTNAFDLSAEWEGFDINTEYGLGYHGSTCLPPDVPFGWNPFNIGCEDGSFSYDESSDEWTLISNCFNPDAAQDDLTFAFQDKCGDVELSAKIESITGLGWAGLMLRESTAPGSKYVWIYKNAGNAVHWAIRKADNTVPQVSSKFAFGKQWLKIKRVGNLFTGYTSSNGVIWKLEFQSFIYMDECLFAGPAVHSNVDYANTTAVFSHVSFGGNGSMMQTALNEGPETAIGVNVDRDGQPALALPELAEEVMVQEVTLHPNPVANWLEVAVPENFGEEIFISIVDMNGKVIFTDRFEDQVTRLELDIAALNLSEGAYLLNLSSATQNVTKRFVKTN